MAYRPLSSLIPNAIDLLGLDVGALGNILLVHLKSCEGAGGSVYQNGLISQTNFLNSLTPTGHGQQPEYGDKQPVVNKALMEAWNWLEREGILIRDPTQPAPWFSISRRGEELIGRNARFERLETFGVERIKNDLLTGGIQLVGGTAENQEEACEWVEMKEGKRPSVYGGALPPKRPQSSFELTESMILKKLEAVLPSAASSYKQAIWDLKDDSRQSMRGTAVELREALREVLDHLAADEDVEKMAGFKLDNGQTKPTMRQKARYVLRSRRSPESTSKAADDAVSLIDDMVGQLVRSVYTMGAYTTHVTSARSQVKQLKMYVETVLAELLNLHGTV